jgi:L-amino acid N-acyltransferase YncA
MNVRKVKLEDAGQITDIYNFYILNTHHTFEVLPLSLAEMQSRIDQIAKNYPFLVCEENDEILGYAYAAGYKPREAYSYSSEISVYIKNDSGRKGIGKSLYQKLFEELSKTKVHAVIAGIALPNEASVRLHEKFGFEKVAHFREVGFKLGRWIDVGYWELLNQK